MIFVYEHIKWGVGFNFGTFCFYKDYTDLVILIVSQVLILQIDGGLQNLSRHGVANKTEIF